MMDKVHVCMYFHIASNKSTAANKTRFFPRAFFISSSWFLNLAEAFRNDQVVACSTALRSTTEKNEVGGYVPFSVRAKRRRVVKQLIRLSSSDVTTLVTTEHIRNKYSLLKSRSVKLAVLVIANLLTLSFSIYITAPVN